MPGVSSGRRKRRRLRARLGEPGGDQQTSTVKVPRKLVEEREAGQHICEVTLKNRNLTKAQFIQEASFTPSGVVRIAKLQTQGSAYIKP